MPSLPQREAEGVKALRPLRGDRAGPVGLDALGLLRKSAGKVKGVVCETVAGRLNPRLFMDHENGDLPRDSS